MNNLVIKLSCEKMEQEVSVKQANGVYVVELTTTKNELIPEHTGEVISWSCITYGDALQKYLQLAAEQAKHIALMSL